MVTVVLPPLRKLSCAFVAFHIGIRASTGCTTAALQVRSETATSSDTSKKPEQNEPGGKTSVTCKEKLEDLEKELWAKREEMWESFVSRMAEQRRNSEKVFKKITPAITL